MNVSISLSPSPLTGTHLIGAIPTKPGDVTRVEFYIDGVLKTPADTSAPFNYSWDTRTVSDGLHTVVAKAFYPRNKVATSPPATRTVSNAVTPPPPPPVQGPPVNTVLPAITGTATEGQALSVSLGTWTNSPTSYTRQWTRCNASGASCVPIPSATGGTYTLTSTDVGATIRCAVTAFNSVGASATIDTVQTAVVAALAPAVPTIVTAPTITGAAVQNNTLAVSNGAWTNAPTSYTRKWQRCNSSGASCVEISGATGSNYVLTSSDVGSTIRCEVTAVNVSGNSVPAPTAATVVVTPVAPPAPPPSGPITITAGGTYTGHWVSTSTTVAAVTINTNSPVIIRDSIVKNQAGGPLIRCQFGPVQVTVERTYGYGAAGGRFFISEGFKSVTIRNCEIDKSRGIELQQPVSLSTVSITKNRHRNIQGNGTSPVGNFVQLREVQNANPVDISWNEILNEYNLSNPEDIISCYKSAHVRLHDNYFQHQSKPGNAYNTSSQNPVTIENGDGIPPSSNDNIVTANQIIDCVGGVGIFGGSNNSALNNRVIQDGKLPDGVTQMGNGYEAMYIAAGGTNNHMHGNVIGFVNRDNSRQDGTFTGAPEGHTAERANNTILSSPITQAMELAEWSTWQSKLASNGITVGVTPSSPPPPPPGVGFPASYFTGPLGQNNILPPRNPGVLMGVWSQGNPGADRRAAFLAREASIGRQLDFYSTHYASPAGACDYGNGYSAFTAGEEQWAIDTGHLLIINWVPGFTMAQVNSGLADACLTQFGQRAGAFGHRFLLRIYYEFDGTWFPWSACGQTFINGWRRTVTQIRNAGGTNVGFIWSPAGKQDRVCSNASYPGDEWVDWVATSLYNRDDPNSWYAYDHGGWAEYREILSAPTAVPPAPFDTWAGRKPYMTGETGVEEDPSQAGRKGQWFTTARDNLKASYPGLRAIIYFDQDVTAVEGWNWKIDSTQSSLDGYTALANDAHFKTR